MEEAASLVTLELAEAIEACRSGAIPDMKTELGLLRLADHLGYLPQLRCFVDELPPALAARLPVSASLHLGDAGGARQDRHRGSRPAAAGTRAFRRTRSAAAGAEIPGFVVTSPASRDAVRPRLGGRARHPGARLHGPPLAAAGRAVDALAILSPAETHGGALESALAAGLHVLCEKPFVWGAPELGARAHRLAHGFETRGLLLWENCQWPYMLPAFERLHPGASRAAAPARGPAPARLRRGAQMLGDAVPHVLSLIQALLPGGERRIERLRFSGGRPASEAARAGFAIPRGRASLDVEIALLRSDRHPREASSRSMDAAPSVWSRGDGYQLSFAGGGRTVPLPDPLSCSSPSS